MNIRKLQKRLALVAVTTGLLAAGCELVVDFDRTKIPAEGLDASMPEPGDRDGAAPLDAGDTDASEDAGPDAEAEGEDAGPDAEAEDAGPDAEAEDAGPDAGDIP